MQDPKEILKSLGYHIKEDDPELGRGSYATVYSVVKDSLPFAVKLFRQSPEMSDSERKRFRREAKVLSSLKHSKIVRIIDFGETPVPYIVMDQCTCDLKVYSISQDFSAAHVKNALPQMLAAIKHLHENGLIHRDIKPSNFGVKREGKKTTVLLLDFGVIGKSTPDQADSDRLTKSGELLGTYRYMAPEASKENFSPASDVWSLGATLYFMLTGQTLFQKANTLPQFIRAIDKEKILPPIAINSSIPETLSEFCMLCLERDISKRPQDGQDALNAYEELKAGNKSRLNVPISVTETKTQTEAKRVSYKLVALTLVLLPVIMFMLISNEQLKPTPFSATTLALNPQNQNWLAYVTAQGTVSIVDSETNELLWTTTDRFFHKAKIAWSRDGQNLGIAGCDGCVYFWSVAKENEPRKLSIQLDYFAIDVECSPNGQFLACLGRDGQTLVVDPDSDRLIGTYRVPAFAGGSAHGLCVEWESDSTHLLVAGGGSYDYLARWNIHTNEKQILAEPSKGNFSIRQIACSPTGNYVAVTRVLRGDLQHDPRNSFFCELVVLNSETGNVVFPPVDISEKVQQSRAPRSLAWIAADSEKVRSEVTNTTNDEKPQIRKFDQIDGQILVYTDADIIRIDGNSSEILANYPEILEAIHWNKTRIAGITNGSIRVFKKVGFGYDAEWKSEELGNVSITSLTPTADGFIASDSMGHTYFWSPSGTREFSEPANITVLAAHPKQNAIATGGDLGTVRLNNLGAGKDAILKIDGAVQQLAWSPNGSRLACGTNQGNLVIFDCKVTSPVELFETRQWKPDDFELEFDSVRITGLAWLSENELLAGISIQRRDGQLWILSLDGKQPRMLKNRTAEGKLVTVDRISSIVPLIHGGFIAPSHYGIAGYWGPSYTFPEQIRTDARYSSLGHGIELSQSEIILAASDGSCWVWSDNSCKQIKSPSGIAITASCRDLDRNRVLIVDALGRVTVLDDETFEVEKAVETSVYQAVGIVRIQNEFVLGGQNGQIVFLDAETLTETRSGDIIALRNGTL